MRQGLSETLRCPRGEAGGDFPNAVLIELCSVIPRARSYSGEAPDY